VASEPGELKQRFVPAPAALATWLAVPLVGAKVVHWSWPGIRWSVWPEWLRDVGVSAHADVAFSAAFGLVAFVLLRLARGWPRLQAGVGAGLFALSTFSVFYAVASVQIFAFLRSPLTYPLLYLAGDAKSMSSSIGSFLSPALVAALVLVPLLHVLAVRRASRPRPGPPGRTRRALGFAVLAAVPLWVAWGAWTAAGRWADRPDLLICESPHLKFVASLVDEARSGAMPLMRDEFPSAYLSDFDPSARAHRRATGKRKLPVLPETPVPARRGRGTSSSSFWSRRGTTTSASTEARTRPRPISWRKPGTRSSTTASTRTSASPRTRSPPSVSPSIPT
jgi:hypothetical protein